MSTYIEKRSMDLQKPIENAKEPMVLEVKAIDVVRASEKNSKCCAFVRACEREVQGAQAAFFFRTVAFIEYQDKIVRYQLPQSVQREIVSFDRNGTLDPGVYQLSPQVPSKSPRMMKKADTKRTQPKTNPKGRFASGIKRSIVHKTQGVRTKSEPGYRSRP